MNTKTYHSLEEMNEKESSLEWTWKGYGDTIRMWRESECHLEYTHYMKEKRGEKYTSILTKNGWTKVHTFHNKHTDHEVELWIKNL